MHVVVAKKIENEFAIFDYQNCSQVFCYVSEINDACGMIFRPNFFFPFPFFLFYSILFIFFPIVFASPFPPLNIEAFYKYYPKF